MSLFLATIEFDSFHTSPSNRMNKQLNGSFSCARRTFGRQLIMNTFCSFLQLIEPSVTIKIVDNTPDDPRQRKPDITKAKQLLRWAPKVTLREGLPLMEEDFRKRLGVPKKA